MRKVILSEMVSLEGFMTGPSGELDWPLLIMNLNAIPTNC
jgi:hypothetical protein